MSDSNELYVDIPALQEVPERFYNLKKQMMEKVALIESSEKYLRFHLSGSENLCAEVRRIQSELEGIGTTFEQMGQVLETICDLYAACESKEAEVEIQLKKKEDVPWYQTNTFKWVEGSVVVVGAGIAAAAVLTVGAPLLLTTFVVGAAIGAATGAVAGGIIGGIAAEKNGGTFADGVADGFFRGSIGGFLSGGIALVGAEVGAGCAVTAAAEGLVSSGIYMADAYYDGGQPTANGVVLSFGVGTAAVVGGAVLAPAITNIKKAVVGAVEKSIARGIEKTVSKEVMEKAASATGKAAAKSVGETGYAKSSLNLLKDTENFTDTSIEHIFDGNIKRGKAGGYHYECIEDSAGKVIPSTEQSVNELGVYKAQVEVNGIPKTANGGYSTFFPKNMSPQEIIDAINEAYTNRSFIEGTRNTYRGTASNGIEIEIYIGTDGKIISAFPKE